MTPSVEQNTFGWGQDYHWERGGDEWSDPFGGTDVLWDHVLMPRIGHLLGGRTLEIAPGHGRMTAKLLPLVEHLVAVDLNESCIERCSERFAGRPNLDLFKNDGRSLPMASDGSIDFVFSFDSLVHVDADVMGAYLDEVARLLTPTGSAFIHHSNVGSYLNPIGKMMGNRVRNVVNKRANRSWRGPDVSATWLRTEANRRALKLNVAEQVNWGSRMLNDCFSLISRSGDETSIKNWRFFQKSSELGAVVQAYRGGGA